MMRSAEGRAVGDTVPELLLVFEREADSVDVGHRETLLEAAGERVGASEPVCVAVRQRLAVEDCVTETEALTLGLAVLVGVLEGVALRHRLAELDLEAAEQRLGLGEALGELVAEGETLCEGEAVGEALRHSVAVEEGVPVGSTEALCVPLGAALPLTVGQVLGEELCDCEVLGLLLVPLLREEESVALLLREALPLREGETEALGQRLSMPLRVPESVGEALAHTLCEVSGELVELCEGVKLADCEGEPEGVAPSEGVRSALRVQGCEVATAEGVRGAVGVPPPPGLAVAQGEGVLLCEGLGEAEAVTLGLGERVPVREDESVALAQLEALGEGVCERLPVPVGEGRGEREGWPLALGQGEAEAEAEGQALALPERVPLGEALAQRLGEAVPLRLTLGEPVAQELWLGAGEPLALKLPELLADTLTLALARPVRVGEALAVAQALRLREAVRLPVPLPEGQALGEGEPPSEALGEGEAEAERLAEGEALAEALGVPCAPLGVRGTLALRCAVVLGVALLLAVVEREREGLGVAEGQALAEREVLGEALGQPLALAEGQALSVAVPQALTEAVALRLRVRCALRLRDSVTLPVGERVVEDVGEGVALAEAVGVALPCTRTSAALGTVGASASVMGALRSTGKSRGALLPSRLPTPVKVRGSMLYRDSAAAQGSVAEYCCRLAPAGSASPAERLRASTKGAAAPASSSTRMAEVGAYTSVAGRAGRGRQARRRSRVVRREVRSGWLPQQRGAAGAGRAGGRGGAIGGGRRGGLARAAGRVRPRLWARERGKIPQTTTRMRRGGVGGRGIWHLSANCRHLRCKQRKQRAAQRVKRVKQRNA